MKSRIAMMLMLPAAVCAWLGWTTNAQAWPHEYGPLGGTAPTGVGFSPVQGTGTNIVEGVIIAPVSGAYAEVQVTNTPTGSYSTYIGVACNNSENSSNASYSVGPINIVSCPAGSLVTSAWVVVTAN